MHPQQQRQLHIETRCHQKRWYQKLEKSGFDDIENEQGMLKQWSGSRSLTGVNDGKIIDLIDLHIHQPEYSQVLSSFPEPAFSQKEEFIASIEFKKACLFICKHKNSTLTPHLIERIWKLHCDGDSERAIEVKINLCDTKIHHAIRKLTEWMNTMPEATNSQDPYDENREQIRIISRHFVREKDSAFIYSSWRNALWYDEERPENESIEFYKKSNKFIRELLNKKTSPPIKIRIACFYDDPDQIVGYAVLKGDNLEWVYVKLTSRNQGIARLLTKGFKTISVPSTKLGALIAKEKNLQIKEK